MRVVGIMVEDGFVKCYKGLGNRFVGYIWVLAFLSWSVPAYLYPILARSGPGHETIPFSVVGRVWYGKW